MNTAASTPARPPTSGLAIASLVCTFVCGPVGIVLAIIALVKISKEGKDRLGGRGLAIAALALNLMCIPASAGMMAAIAIPNFVKFQCRSKQSEAKSNLKSAYIALESFKGEHNRYGSLEEAGFTPQGETVRYDYELVDKGEDHFLVRASGKGDMAGDVWEINGDNALQNISSTCGQLH